MCKDPTHPCDVSKLEIGQFDISSSILQCVAVCCSVLQCVAVCCRVLQSAAVCCSVNLQQQQARARIVRYWQLYIVVRCSVLHCVAMRCSVLQ